MAETEQIAVAEASDGFGCAEEPGTEVTLPVVELLTGRGFVTGKSGSGKSNSASVIAEKLLDNGFGILIVDIDGEYYGLKEEYEILHAGGDEECDIQITADHSDKLASLALEQNVPIILDVSSYLNEEKAQEILTAVSRSLFAKAKKQKQPFLMLVEEVHEYIPEKGSVGECGRMLIKIGKRGRKHGLGICGISQRPADVKKDFITQCDWLLWHRLTWNNDTKVVGRILDNDYAEAVEDLGDGEGFLMTDWAEIVQRVQFYRKQTFDAGATPGLDDFERPDLKSVSDDLVSELQDISDEQKRTENRIAELREELDKKNSRIAELERELQDARDLSRMAEQFVEAMIEEVNGPQVGKTERERMRESVLEKSDDGTRQSELDQAVMRTGHPGEAFSEAMAEFEEDETETADGSAADAESGEDDASGEGGEPDTIDEVKTADESADDSEPVDANEPEGLDELAETDNKEKPDELEEVETADTEQDAGEETTETDEENAEDESSSEPSGKDDGIIVPDQADEMIVAEEESEDKLVEFPPFEEVIEDEGAAVAEADEQESEIESAEQASAADAPAESDVATTDGGADVINADEYASDFSAEAIEEALNAAREKSLEDVRDEDRSSLTAREQIEQSIRNDAEFVGTDTDDEEDEDESSVTASEGFNSNTGSSSLESNSQETPFSSSKADERGDEPRTVREIKADIAELPTKTRKMLTFYCEQGPDTPLNAHFAAGGDGNRTDAYARNRKLRTRGLIEHIGRGNYQYRLRELLSEQLPASFGEAQVDEYANRIEQTIQES